MLRGRRKEYHHALNKVAPRGLRRRSRGEEEGKGRGGKGVKEKRGQKETRWIDSWLLVTQHHREVPHKRIEQSGLFAV